MNLALEPKLLWLEAQALAATVPAGFWQILARLTATTGGHARRRAGDGQDFWQYRPLCDGESLTGVDWRKSARSDVLFKREREQQSQKRYWLWCDMSPSMHYQSARAPRSKAQHAYLLAAALLHLATSAGESLRLLAAPTCQRADLPFALAADRPCDLAHAAPEDVVFLISDFIGFDFANAQTARQIIALHILDPDEIDFPFAGPIRFEGLEAESPLQVRNAAARRDDYLAAQAELQRYISDISLFVISCSSAKSPAAQLRTLLQAPSP